MADAYAHFQKLVEEGCDGGCGGVVWAGRRVDTKRGTWDVGICAPARTDAEVDLPGHTHRAHGAGEQRGGRRDCRVHKAFLTAHRLECRRDQDLIGGCPHHAGNGRRADAET